MKPFYNLSLNLLIYSFIFFVVLIPFSKADYAWNGNLTLSGGELTGSVGSVNITIEELSQAEGGKSGADGNITISPITMYQPEDFPGVGDLINFGITGVTTFREDHGQSYKLTFSQPVDNPLVAISSLGNPSNINTFTIDSINGGSAATTNILWQQNSSSGFTTSVGSGNTNYNLDASVSIM